MATMTIAEALLELRTLDRRITGVTANTQFVGMVTPSNDRVGGRSISDFNRLVESSLQSWKTLRNRRMLLKQRIVESNAKTLVTVAGDTMTVAAAIELRKHGIGYDRAMLATMQRQWTEVSGQILKHNTAARANAEKIASQVQGVSAEQLAALVEQSFESNKATVVNPVQLEREIERLSLYIEEFDAKFDLAINAANYATTIEI